MISRLQTYGGRRLFIFSLHQYSTNSAAVPLPPPPQTHILLNYLISSLGFSKEEAISATQKVVPLPKSSRNDPNLVLNFLQNLGLNKTQIKSIVSTHPRVLTSDVEKTLKPKLQILQELGMSGSDLIKFLIRYKSFFSRSLKSQIRPPIDYLRNLLGCDKNVFLAIKRCNSLIDPSAPKLIASNVEVLKEKGLSDEDIRRLVLDQPMKFKYKSQILDNVVNTLENEFGISPDSKMFYHGIVVLFPFYRSTIDRKFGVFKSLGWSDKTIYSVFRKYPYIISVSEDKLRKVWNFFVTELGYKPDYLAAHPSFLNFNFERRVKLRSDILKILNENKLNRKKAGLSSVLQMKESKFVNEYLMPYKDQIPEVFESYLNIRRDEKGNLSIE